MQTVPTLSVLSLGVLGLVACTARSPGDPPDPPTGAADLEIRHSGAAVAGSSFQCTGSWPSPLTPCGYSWTSQPTTLAIAGGDGKVRLVLRRSPMPVDGGASTVYIDLGFDPTGTVGATGQESTTQPPLGKLVEASKSLSGWLDPVAISAAAGARQAGTFSLSFAWGTISGAYDTAPVK